MEKFDDIVKAVAYQNGVTPDEVLREMQKAIDYAYDNHDQEAQQLWDMMTFEGERPTPEEFIMQVAMIIQSNQMRDGENHLIQ